MYQVLYRKWRPKIFDDVVGQPQVTVTLKNELKAQRINHAYLFTGSRGTGKTSCAKIMAKAVNCLNPIDGDPCGECEICRGIDDGSILDISEIDAASNNGVSNVRTIIDEAVFSPTKAKYRVYIIDEVHMLSTEAFNALLKTLEEPPSHVIFILATTEVHKIPATILSRCQRFDFHRISPENIAKRLEFVAQNENVSLDYEAALLIASVSDGALRDSLSLLDRCIGESENISIDVVHKAAGLAGHKHLFTLTDCIIKKDTQKSLEIIENLYNQSKDMGRLCEEIIDHFRNLMLIKTVKKPYSMMVFSAGEKEKAEKQSDNMSLEEIMYIITVFQNSYDKMFKGSNKRMEMELSLIKLTSEQLNSSVDALLSRIARLERIIKNGLPIKNTKNKEINIKSIEISKEEQITVPTEKNQKAEQKQNPINSKQSKINDFDIIYKNAVLMEDWQEVLNILKTYSVTIATAFKNTRAYISGEYILIDSQNELAFNLLKQPAQREKMREVVREVTGKTYKLGPYKRVEQQETSGDAMTEFLQKAKSAGIPVEEK